MCEQRLTPEQRLCYDGAHSIEEIRMRYAVNILILLTIISLGVSCTRSSVDNEPPSECSPYILNEDYEGPTRMLLGIGEGAITAVRLRGLEPEKFASLATVAGPTDIKGLLAMVRVWLNSFDQWEQDGAVEMRRQLLTDLFTAMGNPLYDNPDSKLYPPGVTAENFQPFEPVTVNGIISPDNPDGSLPAVTFVGADDVPIIFALAIDQNQNGVRDAGEPIILHLEEPFDDANENGIYDQGEEFSDYGIDQVDGTSDYGEGNGIYDVSPIAETYLTFDPAIAIAGSLEYVFEGSLYSDIGTRNPWGFQTLNEDLFARLGAETSGATGRYCIEDVAATYTDYLWEETYPLTRPFIAERFVWMQSPSNDDEILHRAESDNKSLRIRRMIQALYFLQARVPNWLLTDNEKDGQPLFERHELATSFGFSVRYTISLPPGYYRDRNRWKTYPVMYVFPERGVSVESWKELHNYQNYLTYNNFGSQILIVTLDPQPDALANQGYSFFTGPVDLTEGDGRIDEGALLSELMDHIENKYRANRN